MPTKDRYVFGSTDPAKTASFYRALGIPLKQHVKGLNSCHSGELNGMTMAIEPSENPRRLNPPHSIAFATLVPSIQVVIVRLCADGHITDEDQAHIRHNDGYRTVTLQDPDGRNVLVVEGPPYNVKTVKNTL